MKKLSIIFRVLLISVVCFSCGKKGMVLAPMYTEMDMNNLPDGIYPVNFNVEDFSKDKFDLYLTCEIYSEDIFDAVDTNMLKAGDEIVYGGKTEKIKNVVTNDKGNEFAFNVDNFEDAEYVLTPFDYGGIYRLVGMDDYSTYTKRGNAKLPIAKTCVLRDSSSLDNPDRNVKFNDMMEYVDEDKVIGFHHLNTHIMVEDGYIVDINRFYTP